MVKEIFVLTKIIGCSCDRDCGGSEVYYEGREPYSNWVEEIPHAKEYESRDEAIQAIDDYATFYEGSKAQIWFHVETMYKL